MGSGRRRNRNVLGNEGYGAGKLDVGSRIF